MSVLGASSIIYDILSDRKEKLKSPYYRILLVMGCVDTSSSFWIGLSTWPVPRGTAYGEATVFLLTKTIFLSRPCSYSAILSLFDEVYGAVGTTASCTAQGFFAQLNLLSPLYNLNLALYYLLLGKYHLTDKEIANRYERYMHPISLIIAIVIAIAGLPLTLYNNANLWCWIAPYPSNCEENNGDPGEVPCERGQDAWLYRWLFFYCILWIIIVTVTVIMVLLIRSAVSDERRFIALQKETRSKRPSARIIESSPYGDENPILCSTMDLSEAHRYERSRQTFRQAMFYLGVFYLTWVFQTVNRLYQLITGESVFILLVLHTIFAPLHGFFNFIVYRHGQITV